MSWNYRVIKRNYDGVEKFGIYEVYYNENDEPTSCTKNPVPIESFNLKELEEDIDKIREALSEPVLNYKKFEDLENEESHNFPKPSEMEQEPPEITKKVNENIWELFSDDEE